MADNPTRPTPRFSSLHLSDIRESETNPRRRFGDLTDLAESIAAHGILQPVLVRPKRVRGGRFELVVGARRFRGAKLAKLKAIPCVIRELGDENVLEIQLVENAQRADIHPMEEAEAYERLRDKHGRSVPEIAAKVSRSESTILARLKLLSLCDDVRDRFFDEKIGSSVALLIARIPDAKLQVAAAKAVEGESYRSAQQMIERQVMLRLSEAVWKLADEDLVPEAGSCKACPHRTGNQRELFGPTDDKADLCTSPPCFKSKEKAWVKQARKAGRKILVGPKAEKATHGVNALVRIDWVEYDDPKQRTHKAIAGKHLPEADVVLVRDQWSGRFEPYAQPATLRAAKKAAGWTATKRASHRPQTSAAEKKRKSKRALTDLLSNQVHVEVVEATLPEIVEGQAFGKKLLPTLVPGPLLFYVARELLEGFDQWSEEKAWAGILERRGIKASKVSGMMRGPNATEEKALDDWLAKAQPVEAVRLIVEILMASHSSQGEHHFRGRVQKTGATVDQLGRAFGIDVGAIRGAHAGRARTYLEALPKPRRPRKPAKATKAKTKKKKAARKPARAKASRTKRKADL